MSTKEILQNAKAYLAVLTQMEKSAHENAITRMRSVEMHLKEGQESRNFYTSDVSSLTDAHTEIARAQGLRQGIVLFEELIKQLEANK